MTTMTKVLLLTTVVAIVGFFASGYLSESSPLPNRKLADSTNQPAQYQKEYEFTTDWFSGNVPSWEKALANYKGKPNVRFLEIGIFEGRSFFWTLENILTHESARACAISPFFNYGDDRDIGLEERYYRNLELSGQSKKVETIKGLSQNELRRFSPDAFDIIYIDGAHRADKVLEDAVLSASLLKVGGTLIFDDYRLGRKRPPAQRPRTAIHAFLDCYGDFFEVVHNGYQLILVKTKSMDQV